MARHQLRTRREELGLTQQQVAERLGTDIKTYARYERGESTPWPGTRPLLAKALEWTPAKLAVALNDNGTAPNTQQVVPEWLTLYASLEQGASRLWAWQPFTVHALLQPRTTPPPLNEPTLFRAM